MIIFGLTGTIGAGKSFVASCFQKLGAAIFDADAIVHELYLSNKFIINLARDYFPDVVVDGAIDRSILIKYFLQDDEKWKIFESEVHSLVLNKQNNFIAKERKNGSKFLVLDTPLLIETKSHHLCDFIIFVTVNPKLQNQRLQKRNLTKNKLSLMNKRQLSCQIKYKSSNFVINTSLSKGCTFSQVKQIMKSLGSESDVLID